MKRVYLVGFMGSGKSAIGKRLGTLMNLPFYDMDTEIAEQDRNDNPSNFRDVW